MAIKKLIFRRIRGAIRPILVHEGTWNVMRRENVRLDHYRQVERFFKTLRKSEVHRTALFRPGGSLDPLRKWTEEKTLEVARREAGKRSLMQSIFKKAPKDEFSQRLARKKADELKKAMDTLDEFLDAGEVAPASFTGKRLRKRVKANISRSETLSHLSRSVGRGEKAKMLTSDATDILKKAYRGGLGTGRAFRGRKKARKAFGERIAKEIRPYMGKSADIDRIISAKSRGVRFKRGKNKLIITRPWKR